MTIIELPFCLIGKTEAEARKMLMDESWWFRYVEKDGKREPHPPDARIDRISLASANGIITRAYIG